MKDEDAIIAILTGWLMRCVARESDGFLKIVNVAPDPPQAFTLELASGLKLRVLVSPIV